MTSDTLSLLFIGICFTVIGLIACRFYRWRQVKGYIPFLLGLSLIYLGTLGPLSHSKERLNAVTHLDSSRVVEIRLQPTQQSTYKKLSLVSKDVSIRDRQLIGLICQSLHQASGISKGIQNPTQVGRMEITLADASPLVLGLKRGRSSFTLDVFSNGEAGWHYGNLSAPLLSHLIDSLLLMPGENYSKGDQR